MLRLALFFLVVGLVAGAFGLTGVADVSTGIAQFLFVVFLICMAITVALVVAALAGVRRLLGR